MTRKSLVPIGCNMNDASYPFRGIHRMDDCMNHGHTGVSKDARTSLVLRVTGTNLLIEELQTPSGQTLSCELGVGDSALRPFNLPEGKAALSIPGDGRDYYITALVKKGNAKHYCKLSFNGSEGPSVVRVRAPANVPASAVRLLVDGKIVRPVSGWYAIPIHAHSCSLEVDSQVLEYQRAPLSPTSVAKTFVQHSVSPLPGSSAVSIQTERGYAEVAMLQCMGNGQMITLNETETVSVPCDSGPYRLLLPSTTAHITSIEPAPQAPSLVVAPESPSKSVTAGDPVAVPELETRITVSPDSGLVSYTARADGFNIQLRAENGAVVMGLNSATLALPHGGEQRINITLLDSVGRILLRQSANVPALQSAPFSLSIDEEGPSHTRVSARDGARVSVGDVRTSHGVDSLRIDRSMPQNVLVERPTSNGTLVSARLNFGANMSSPAPAAPLPSNDMWLDQLVSALQATSIDEARRLVQMVTPPNTKASTLVSYVMEQLFKTQPVLSFSTQKGVLSEVHCPGYQVMAAVGHEPRHLVNTNSSISVPSGVPAALDMVDGGNGRVIATVRVQPSTTASEEDKDTHLVARLIDALQRHNLDPMRVAEELLSMSTMGFSVPGQRCVPLLAECLRRSQTQFVRDSIYFTCDCGFLSGIHTSDPQNYLTAALNNESPVSIQQRGRFPVMGTLPLGGPHVLKLTARDPRSGEVKAETSVSILGAPSAPGYVMTAASPTHTPGTSLAAQDASPDEGLRRGYIPQTPHHVSSMHDTQLTGSAGSPFATLPYLDVQIQPVDCDVQLRFTTPPDLRIACSVDGVPGEAGLSEFVSRVPGGHRHQVQLSLIDSNGTVVFQQQLEVPPTISPSWGLSFQEGRMIADFDSGCVTTVSVDRTPERVVYDSAIPLDTSQPHHVLLRKYWGTQSRGSCAGEVGLQLPSFPSTKNLEETLRIYRLGTSGDLTMPEVIRQLQTLGSRCISPIERAVISALVEAMHRGECLGDARSRSSLAGTSEGRVYFRLKGGE